MRFTFLLILVATLADSCVPTYKNTITFNTLPADKEVTDTIHIKNLYVSASGNMSTRVVATDLYTALQQIVEKNGSVIDFGFKDNSRDDPKSVADAIDSSRYDGYMVLSTRTSASIDYYQEKYVFSVSPIAGEVYGNAYEETFMADVFNPKRELIYSSEINFHFDPTKNRLYAVAAKKLIAELAKSNIRLW